MEIIDLRSDTVTRPSPGMRKAIAEAEVGDDVFGDDPTVIKLEQMVAGLLGKPAALYFPSGTMSNQVAIRCLTQRGDEAIIEYDAHIFRYEAASGAALSGIQFNTIQGNRGVITAEEIATRIRPKDYHQPRTALVCLENTHNKAGGTLFPLEEMKKIRNLCLENGIRTYLDGARLWNASAASGISLDKYAGHFDLVSVCLSKGLGAPVGSVLTGSDELIRLARRYRKAFGGGMRQVGIIAAAGIYALQNNLNRLVEDHRRARKIAETLSQLPGIRIDLDAIQTNIVIFEITAGQFEPAKVLSSLKERGVMIVWMGGRTFRAVCHLDIDDDDISKSCEIFQEYFNEQIN